MIGKVILLNQLVYFLLHHFHSSIRQNNYLQISRQRFIRSRQTGGSKGITPVFLFQGNDLGIII